MDLILWRHAEAELPTPLLADEDRRLTPKGIKQAAKMANWLDAHLPENCRILVSPTTRTKETVAALKRKFKIVDELSPGATAESILATCNWPHHKKSVLIVGHQPSLGWVASQLLFPGAQECEIRKGTIWWIAQKNCDDRTTTNYLKIVMTPSLLHQ
jgi:phosphohistidine phosphatase